MLLKHLELKMNVGAYIKDSRQIIADGKGHLQRLTMKTKEWAQVQQDSTNLEHLSSVTYDGITILSKALKDIHKALDELTKLQESNAIQVSNETSLLSEQFKVMNATLGLDQFIKELKPANQDKEFRVDVQMEEVVEDSILTYEFNSVKTVGMAMELSAFDSAATGPVVDTKGTLKREEKGVDNKKSTLSRPQQQQQQPILPPPPVQTPYSPPVLMQVPSPPTTQPTPAVHIKRAKVLYNYEATEQDELTIKSGDMIDVLNEDYGDGWALGICDGKKGLFPRSYAQIQ